MIGAAHSFELSGFCSRLIASSSGVIHLSKVEIAASGLFSSIATPPGGRKPCNNTPRMSCRADLSSCVMSARPKSRKWLYRAFSALSKAAGNSSFAGSVLTSSTKEESSCKEVRLMADNRCQPFPSPWPSANSNPTLRGQAAVSADTSKCMLWPGGIPWLIGTLLRMKLVSESAPTEELRPFWFVQE